MFLCSLVYHWLDVFYFIKGWSNRLALNVYISVARLYLMCRLE